MEARRLIEATRLALTQADTVQDTIAEAWQAQALAEAIGGYFAGSASFTTRWEAEGLSEAGGRACGALRRPALNHPTLRTGAIRARQLTEVRDPRRALLALGVLLGDVGIALVEVACGAEEGLYWQCVEAVDAADESRDRVFGMLRELPVRAEGGAA
ncbi:DUF6099 family protein [Streptomyces sp. NPDC057702]|uniref:DUF6099 family protein n=1 Tax=unclassified Streptomyces TaxID=2593676 RepID=UPI0036967798